MESPAGGPVAVFGERVACVFIGHRVPGDTALPGVTEAIGGLVAVLVLRLSCVASFNVVACHGPCGRSYCGTCNPPVSFSDLASDQPACDGAYGCSCPVVVGLDLLALLAYGSCSGGRGAPAVSLQDVDHSCVVIEAGSLCSGCAGNGKHSEYLDLHGDFPY